MGNRYSQRVAALLMFAVLLSAGAGFAATGYADSPAPELLQDAQAEEEPASSESFEEEEEERGEEQLPESIPAAEPEQAPQSTPEAVQSRGPGGGPGGPGRPDRPDGPDDDFHKNNTDWDSWDVTVTKEATCETEGSADYVCTVCGYTKTVSIPALGHKWGGWTTTKEATCTEKGEQRRECERCDAFETRDIKAKNHTAVKDAAKAPTCTETGLTEGKHCSTCGAVLKPQETVPALGHKWGSWMTTKEATCTEKGEQRRECERCDAFETRDVKAKNHTAVKDAAKAPTCTETGLTEGEHCSTCGAVLKPQETVPALGHKWGSWMTTKEATCTEKGEQRRECTRCDAFETRETPKNPDNHADHGTHLTGEKPATCTETGYTGDRRCDGCDGLIEEGQTIPQLDHSWEEGTVTAQPTCTEMGVLTYTCTSCGGTRTEALPALGHAWQTRTEAEIGSVERGFAHQTETGSEWITLCPVTGVQEGLERLSLVGEANTTYGGLILRRGRLVNGMETISVAFYTPGERQSTVCARCGLVGEETHTDGVLVHTAGQVVITLPAAVVEGYDLRLIGYDGAETALPVEIAGDTATLTVPFEGQEARLIRLLPAGAAA